MTEVETDPAESPRQAEDGYLAAVSALLLAIATNGVITPEECDTLLDAMPDIDLRDGLRVGLGMLGLRG